MRHLRPRLHQAAVQVIDAQGTPREILRPTTLALDEPRIAFIGPNGSGKSTILRLLNGLVLPTAGTVVVGGRETAREAAAIRRQVGFVFTDPEDRKSVV